MLREVEGLSTAETADCLGISDDAVKVPLHRARGLLRKDILCTQAPRQRQHFSSLVFAAIAWLKRC
jgi:predicted transcriptional regulator